MGKRSTIDEIVLSILPKLKNGVQPTKQLIMDEMRKIATPVEGKYWALWDDPQQLFEFASDLPGGTASSAPRKPEDKYEHNEILHLLAKLGQAAGFACHIGKKEQSSAWDGQSLSEISPREALHKFCIRGLPD